MTAPRTDCLFGQEEAEITTRFEAFPDEPPVEWSHPIGLDGRFRSPIETHVVLPAGGP